jgi:hypothetical protein
LNFASLEEDLRRKLLMMQNPSTRALMNSSISNQMEKPPKTKEFPVHDWGVFGEYEYLGPGTPYTAKHRAGIRPRNRLDQIAYYHDQQYSWTEKHSIPGTRVVTSGIRGISDYGAGSAMIVASVNPWSDLGFKDRVLGLIAGTGLQIQGILRLNPATMIPMAIIDQTFYS